MPAPVIGGNVAAGANKVGRCCAAPVKRAETFLGIPICRVLDATPGDSVFLSVFDLFKIGIGPSSSHTMGPMTAARRFLDEVAGDDWPRPAGAKVARIGASLHGSLAYTGIGHGSDRAVILGPVSYTHLTLPTIYSV